MEIINNLTAFTQNFDIRTFITEGEASIALVRDFYDNISASFDNLCEAREDHVDAITEMRNVYLEKFGRVAGLNSNLLSNELNKLKDFLNTASSSLFQAYLDAPFCQDRENFETQIHKILD